MGKNSIILTIVVILVVIYTVLFMLGKRGWGYAGYHGGAAYRPSVWYLGDTHYYGGQSVRPGSTGGRNIVGGGPGRGK